MAKSFPLDVKKRGPRRSGSKSAASWGLTTVSAACLLGGLGFLVWVLVYWSIPQWRVRFHFRETIAQVTKTRLKQYEAHDGMTYRPAPPLAHEHKGDPRRGPLLNLMPVVARKGFEAPVSAWSRA